MELKQTVDKSALQIQSSLTCILCSSICYVLLCFGHENATHLFFDLSSIVAPTAIFALQACHPLVQCLAPFVAFVLPHILSASFHASAICIASVIFVSVGEFTARHHFWQGILTQKALIDSISLIARVLYLSLLKPMFGTSKQSEQTTVHLTVPSLLFLCSLGSLPFVIAILLFHGDEIHMLVSKGSWDSAIFLGLLLTIIILNMLLQLSLLACLHALSPFGVALLDLGYTGLLQPGWLLPLTGDGHQYRAAGLVLCIAGALLFIGVNVKEGHQSLRESTRSEQC